MIKLSENKLDIISITYIFRKFDFYVKIIKQYIYIWNDIYASWPIKITNNKMSILNNILSFIELLHEYKYDGIKEYYRYIHKEVMHCYKTHNMVYTPFPCEIVHSNPIMI